jgi:nucleoid DNA-binding protein
MLYIQAEFNTLHVNRRIGAADFFNTQLKTNTYTQTNMASTEQSPKSANKPNLTKREILATIFAQTGYRQKQIQETVQLTLNTIANALADGRDVELRKFGVFELQTRKARIGRNPHKPTNTVLIPERIIVKFKAGKELQEGLVKIDLAKFKAAIAKKK